MQTKELLKRPAKVAHALKMLYLVVGIGVIRTMMTVIRHVEVRSPYFLIFTKLSLYVVSLFLIYQAGKGRNWARWSVVLLFAISIPMYILPNFDAMFHNPIHSLLGFLSLGLFIFALVFLFQESSSAWFKAGKVSDKQ